MRNVVLALWALLAAAFLSAPVQAQQVNYGTPIVPGHLGMWAAPGYLVDAGSPANAPPGGNAKELGITGLGLPFCINSQPSTLPGGYSQLCFGANSSGSGSISENAIGGATHLPLSFIVDNGPASLTIDDLGAHSITQSCSDATTLIATDAFVQCVLGTAAAIQTPNVATNALLAATPVTNAPAIVRLDYAVGNGAPPEVFTSSTTACTVNDGGSQVSAPGGCWLGKVSATGGDDREFGATCGTGDSTAAIQAEANFWANYNGGAILVPCPQTVAGSVTIFGNTKLTGNVGTGYQGQSDVPGPSVWPPAAGSAINCTGLSTTCINIGGQGVDIGNILLGNPEPTPPNSGNYVPIIYPYVISTTCSSNWSGSRIHDITLTSVYDGIDLEGCGNYNSDNAGGYATVDHININVALNVGIRAHLIDYTPLRITDVEGWSYWNYNVASLGAYVRSNLKFFDLEYCAACMISKVETPPAKYGMWLDNGQVVNNLGTINLSYVGTMDQINFQNSCQAIAASNTNLSAWINLSNSFMWGDQTSFQCSSNLPMISLPSNFAYLSITNLKATNIDTLLSVGCGTPGTGACPGTAFAGVAYVSLSDLFLNEYATVTKNAPAIEIPSTTALQMVGVNPLFMLPAGGTGKILGPGYDGTQGCILSSQVGGGINQSYNAAAVSDSCGTNAPSTTSGGVHFYVGGTSAGYVGFGTLANGTQLVGPSGTGTSGQVYLKPNNNIGNFLAVGQTSGGALDVNVSGIPSTPISGTGLNYLCVDNAGNIYVKSSCP